MSGYVNVRDHIAEVVGDDWQPAFKAAIDEARIHNRRGVFVPADPADYTVRKPAAKTPSIDLRGLTNFTLLGEGDGSRVRLIGSGSGGSWNMILIAGNATDVTVRGLYLDGNRLGITEKDPGQHTHTIQVGAGSTPGFARRIRILDCSMTDMDGDGVAIIGLAEAFGGGDDVSVLDIIGCRFLKCGRSGVSNQRAAEYVRIHNCHFEDTSDQDIDLEPTGKALDSGPRRYSIIGNTFIHTTKATAVTLSGVSADIPARDNIFAHNHIYGGRVGMVNTQGVQIVGNYIEGGLEHVEPVLQLLGRTDGASIRDNQIVRPKGAVSGKTLSVSSRLSSMVIESLDSATDTIKVPSHSRVSGTGPVTLTSSGTLPTGLSPRLTYWLIRVDADRVQLATTEAGAFAGTAATFSDSGTGQHTLSLVDHPRDVDVSHNQLQSHTGADGDACTALLTNGQACAFTDNDIRSYFSGSVKHAIRSVTTNLIGERTDDTVDELGKPVEPLRMTADWSISRNRIRGDAGRGSYVNGVTTSARGVAMRGVTVNDNVFRGCANQILWNVGDPGSYDGPPTAQGNSGDGTDFGDLTNVSAVCIGGNAGSQADFTYNADGPPPFVAADGSTARRRVGGAVNETLYVREAGAWNPVTTHPHP